MPHAFDKYGVCPGCGYFTNAPLGNLFHIHMEVCPRCGKSKGSWSVVTARPVRSGGFLRPKWHLEDTDGTRLDTVAKPDTQE